MSDDESIDIYVDKSKGSNSNIEKRNVLIKHNYTLAIENAINIQSTAVTTTTKRAQEMKEEDRIDGDIDNLESLEEDDNVNKDKVSKFSKATKVTKRTKVTELVKKSVPKKKSRSTLSLFTESRASHVETLRKNLRAKNRKKRSKVSSSESSEESVKQVKKPKKSKKSKNKNIETFLNSSQMLAPQYHPYPYNLNQYPNPNYPSYIYPMNPHMNASMMNNSMNIPMQMNNSMMNYAYMPINHQLNQSLPLQQQHMLSNMFPINNMNLNNNEYANTNTSTVNPSIDNDSCNYCEEIYKFIILNNLPLKIMTCVYCQKQMNKGSLEFYLGKYKHDLENQYKQILGNVSLDSKRDDNDFNNISIKSEPIEHIKKLHKDKKPERMEFDFSCVNEVNDQFTSSRPIERVYNNKFERLEVAKSNYNINDDKNSRQDNTGFLLDTADTGMSLAEMFKRKRPRLVNNIESRAHSVKELKLNRSTVSDASEDNLEIRNIIKLKKKKESAAGQKITIDLNNQKYKSSYSVGKNEPNPELLDRLINGTRVKVTT